MASSVETDAKVRHALSVFETLRSAIDVESAAAVADEPTTQWALQGHAAAAGPSDLVSSSSPSTARAKVAGSAAGQHPVRQTNGTGKKAKSKGASASSSSAVRGPGDGEEADVDTYAYTSPEMLEEMNPAQLRRRLVTAEGLLHRLHRQHRAATHKMTFLESQYEEQAAKVQRLEAADAATEVRLQTRCHARECDLRAHHEEALKRLHERHQKELSTLTRRHDAAMQKCQRALAEAEAKCAEKTQTAAAATASEEAKKAKKEASALRIECEDLRAKVSTLEARLSSSSRACSEACDHPQSRAEVESRPKRSEHVTRLQDQITTLEFRVKQLAQHCDDLQEVQLSAVLSGDVAPSASGKKSMTALVNQEVRKLFECLKRRMAADAIVMEAERSRLNELLYGLEHELSARH